MKISVALATYNGAQYLREQLDSIAKQTILPFELVVSDDGSTDQTLDIILDFASTVSFPVRILENKQKLGYRRNFLHVAKACYGEAVAFCDQDDIWHNDKLERAGKALRHKDVLLFHHEAETFSDKENINTKKIQK
ncbi:glycosyltransferase, partial [Acetobacter sicerae]